MRKVIVAPVGDYLEELYIGVREFPTEKVVLITPQERLKEAQDVKENLSKLKIPVEVHEISGMIWEEIFKEVGKIKQDSENEVIVQVSTGDRESRCAATSAAFVNGLKAFGIDQNDEIFMLPVLKFSYYNTLSDKKMKILQAISGSEDCCSSLEELSKKVNMSLPLIAYHINGTLKSEGLKTMELVQTKDEKGRVKVSLSRLGDMLLKGYVK